MSEMPRVFTRTFGFYSILRVSGKTFKSWLQEKTSAMSMSAIDAVLLAALERV
jgi:cyanate lyase